MPSENSPFECQQGRIQAPSEKANSDYESVHGGNRERRLRQRDLSADAWRAGYQLSDHRQDERDRGRNTHASRDEGDGRWQSDVPEPRHPWKSVGSSRIPGHWIYFSNSIEG